MKVTVLGSSCSSPTKDRNLSSVALNFDGLNYLFDCPEGVQRQMMKAKTSYMKISHIFLSHFHGDHILGIPGLIATMSTHQRDWPLTIFGPKGVHEKVMAAIRLSLLNVNFEVKTKEAREGIIVDEKNFFVEAVKLKHDVPCYGYVFKEKNSKGKFLKQKALDLGIPEGPLFSKLQGGESVKVKGKTFKPSQVLDESKKKIGKKFSFIGDTRPVENYFKAIKDSDLLVHESAFLEKMKPRARETFHSTAKEAAMVAKKTHAKKLLLIHLSPRHKNSEQFENEARMVFSESIVARDLIKLEV